MRGEAKVTLPKAYSISLQRDIALGTCNVFTRELLRLLVSFCLRWMAKWQRVCIEDSVKVGKSVTESLKLLREGFGEHLNGIHVSRPVECRLKMNVQGDQPPEK
jgi:hypothetical protein